MNLVDTCGWLEYIAHSSLAKNFMKPIEDTENLLVPTIVLYEVFKKVLKESGENDALSAIAYMQMARVVDLDADISLYAAKVSTDHKLPMADSLIVATAYKFGATIFTQDEHFNDLPKFYKVKYFPKK